MLNKLLKPHLVNMNQRSITLLLCLYFLCSFFLLSAQDQKYGFEDLDKLPPAPNYSQMKYWASHPDLSDPGDLVPGKGTLKENQANAKVDVFFVHPTIYTKKQNPAFPWNADVNDEELNKEVDETTIKNQATVFNGSARVYAPRYRQAHLNVFYTEDFYLKAEALDNAYQDVKAAFQYYLNNYNQGRPIIIASHSQGTIHAGRLLKDFFENQALQKKLVAAYIVGMPIEKKEFTHLQPCENADETGCWMTWNTYAFDYYPPNYEEVYKNCVSTNPLNWTLDDTPASYEDNKGGVLKNYKKILKNVCDAQNQEGILWIHKPKFFGSGLLNWQRYHIVDYNLFYLNIRENVAHRVAQYLQNN